MKKILRSIIGLLATIFRNTKIDDLLMWPIATRVLGGNYREIIELKDGFKMWGFMDDILSRKILFLARFKKNLWEPSTCFYLEKYSKDSKNILIAGSHIGYMVLKSALVTKGNVHTFEPVEKLFTQSKLNFELNPELNKKIILNQQALGDTLGKIPLYIEDIRSSAIPYSGGHIKHHNIAEVDVTTIDHYLSQKSFKHFELILLDIEGFEWFALDGAKTCLQSRPTLILEISPRVLSHTEITPEMMIEKVETLGYKIYFIDDYSPDPVIEEYTIDNAEKYFKRDYVNILALKNEK